MGFEQRGKGLPLGAAASHAAVTTLQLHWIQSQPQGCMLLGNTSTMKTRPPMRTVAFLLIHILFIVSVLWNKCFQPAICKPCWHAGSLFLGLSTPPPAVPIWVLLRGSRRKHTDLQKNTHTPKKTLHWTGGRINACGKSRPQMVHK